MEKTKPDPRKTVEPMAAVPWDDDMTRRIAAHFGDKVMEFASYRDQRFLIAAPESVVPMLEYLRDQEQFDYLVDITAVDYPEKPERFELVYILYNYPRSERIRIKTRVPDGYEPRSATSVHLTANWLEREVFDMFGIRFAGHPDMRRILLPDDWQGHPLRKDYSIIQMDDRWVQENLGIDSGQ